MPRVYMPRIRGVVLVPYHIRRTRPEFQAVRLCQRRGVARIVGRALDLGAHDRARDVRCEMITQLKPEEPIAESEAAQPLEVPHRPIASVAGLVRGVDVEMKNALVGAVMAGDDVHLERAFARNVFAGGGLEVRQAGAGMIVSGGDTHLTKGGAQAVLSAGSVTMESAGAGFAIGGRIRVARGGTAVFAITPSLEIQEGGRIVFGRAVSFAVLGGISMLVALGVYLVRRRMPRR